jgi:hypothetical protein
MFRDANAGGGSARGAFIVLIEPSPIAESVALAA